MIKKENIELIINNIINNYFSINLTNNNADNVIKEFIEEPILSSSFSIELKTIPKYQEYKCFSEFVILNQFDLKLDNINLSDKHKKILQNGKWEIDCLINYHNQCSLIEFKYGNYTLSDLLRLIIIMIKIKEVISVNVIYHTNNKLGNRKAKLKYVRFNINDPIFKKLLDYLNNEDKKCDVNKLREDIDIKINNNENNWVCIQIYKDNIYKKYIDISNKENFRNMESLTNIICKEATIKLKSIQSNLDFLINNKIEKIFLENDFEKIKEKNWTSIFRQNVLLNFFNQHPFIQEWIIFFVEEYSFKISPNNIKEISIIHKIKEMVLENKIEEIFDLILKFHYRWSNLLSLNKKIKEKDNEIQENNNILINDNTVITKVINKVSKIIKQVIYEFVKNNEFVFERNNNDDFNDFFVKNFKQKNIDISNVTVNGQNTNELAINSIFILYFYAKINNYNKMIFSKVEEFERESFKSSLSLFRLIKSFNNSKIFNIAFYLNLIKNNKFNDVCENLIIDYLKNKQ